MNRKIIIVVSVVGLLAVGGLLLFTFMRSQRPLRGMMQGSASQGQAAGGLVAVSPEGTSLPPAADSTPAPQNVATQTVGNLKVSLALSPYPPAGFQTSNFEVTLTDENNQAVTDATVNLDLTMPGMYMPPNALAAQHAGQGVYRGTGRFTMRGLWRIEIILQRGDQKISAFFDVNP
jgi:hypothetical protein